MRLRAVTSVAATAASLLLVPFAATADAVVTTSTVIAYVADTDGDKRGELWRRPADGSGTPVKIFSTTNKVWLPALSPDGTRIAYLEDRSGSTSQYTNYRLFVRNTDGSGTARLLYSGADIDGAPAWSRDGARLVFATYDWATDVSATYVVPSSGGALTTVPTAGIGAEPSFSPSGDQVAVDVIDADWNYVGIDLVTLSTGTRARIAGTAGGSDPVWSPDGQYLLFQKLLPCGVGLYRVPVGGGTPVTMREVPGYFLGSHEYSRDGSQIFFGMSRWQDCNPGPRSGNIWLMNADGSGAARITDTPDVFEYSTTVAGGTPVPADVTPPAAPTTTATVSTYRVTLRWPVGGDTTHFVVIRKAQGEPAPASPADGEVVYAGPAHVADIQGTTGSVVDLYVFAYDAWGNVSPPSAVHRARLTAVPLMQRVPLVGVATTDTTSHVRWSDSGSASYQVQTGKKTRSATGVWSRGPTYTSTFTTAGRYLAHTGTQGQSYYFRARAADGFGNFTAWSAPSVSYVPLDDRAPSVAYSTGWTSVSSRSRYLGSSRTTRTAGATLTLRSETSRFVIRGDRCLSCGQFKVYVDGVYQATVDTRLNTTKVRQVLYSSTPLSRIAPHTLKLVAVGTSGRPRVYVDGIAVWR